MKNMTKHGIAALAAAVLFALAACPDGSDDGNGGVTPATDFSYTEKETTITINRYYGTGSRVVIPDRIDGKQVFEISSYAFEGCTGLTGITIPDGVRTIGGKAFYGCTGLTEITIPREVGSIGLDAFYGCTGLTAINIRGWSYSSRDGVLYCRNNNGSTFYLFAYPGGKTGDFTVPADITRIWQRAFAGCTGITGVSTGDGVYSIAYEAFQGCTRLTSVSIGNRVGSIGDRAFYGCTRLAEITIGAGVTEIGAGAFYGCTNLRNITIKTDKVWNKNPSLYGSGSNWGSRFPADNLVVTFQDVTTIDEYAFFRCTGLTSVTIPDGVTSIERAAFGDCTGLTSVTIGANVSISSAFNNGFNEAYNNAGKAAGTYTRANAESTTWTKQ